MWMYERRLQYPVHIKNPDARAAKIIISQFGGPDGELAASMRYLSQRYATPYRNVAGILTDIGTEDKYCALVGGNVSVMYKEKINTGSETVNVWHLKK